MMRAKMVRKLGICCALALLAVIPTCGPAFGQERGRGTAYFGAFLGDVTEERARELKLAEVRGAVVGRVVAESPAAKAGVKEGDVILNFRTEAITGREHFYQLLSESQPSRIVTIGIFRDGALQHLHVTLGERRSAWQDANNRLLAEPNEYLKAAEQAAQEAEDARERGDESQARELASRSEQLRKQGTELLDAIKRQISEGKTAATPSGSTGTYNLTANRHLLAASVVPLSEQLAVFFNVAEGGLLVTEVRPGGLIERAGIRAGDCIKGVNGERVGSAQDLNRQINRLARGDGTGKAAEVVFTLIRDRHEVEAKASLGDK
jgi:S1-C subfamily serine protease